ncbi:cupin domain-containing protein [Pleurocapsa sp. PCC 7319]|uniref:cupin domain-containing protein n=1 Tax=Pleurocapsa sp. PCC 7319 TaxID=118161 RepID=UPI0003463AE6|nr:cupin domain-containing protein [Pleurocapsa sp. PCC 7319]
MNQFHFPEKIRSLPIFQGRFDANKLTTEDVDIYFASYPEKTVIEPHQHDTDNYGVVTQGELILIIDGEEKYFYPGDWYHVEPNHVHAARFEKDTSEIEFWFKEE